MGRERAPLQISSTSSHSNVAGTNGPCVDDSRQAGLPHQAASFAVSRPLLICVRPTFAGIMASSGAPGGWSATRRMVVFLCAPFGHQSWQVAPAIWPTEAPSATEAPQPLMPIESSPAPSSPASTWLRLVCVIQAPPHGRAMRTGPSVAGGRAGGEQRRHRRRRSARRTRHVPIVNGAVPLGA